MNKKRLTLSFCILSFFMFAIQQVSAQYQYEVSTLVPPGSNIIDDGITLDQNGVLYGSFWGIWGGRPGTHVLRIRPDGSMDTIAQGFNRPNGLNFYNGKVIVANGGGGRVMAIDTATGNKTVLAQINGPSSASYVPGTDSLLIVSWGLERLIHVDTSGTQTIISNSNKLNGPVGMAFDPDGALYIGNFNDGRILKYNGSGDFDVFANIGGGIGFITYSDSAILATNHTDKKVYRIPLDGSGAMVIAGSGTNQVADGIGANASFASPNGIVATPSGDTIYVSEFMSKTLRMIIRTSISGMNEMSIDRNDTFIYPNPTNGYLKLDIENSKLISRIQIIDQRGGIALDREIGRTMDLSQIDVSHLNSDVYFVIAYDSEREVILKQKIIVNN